MADSGNRARSFWDNIVAGLVTTAMLSVVLGAKPMVKDFLLKHSGIYREIWAIDEGKKSLPAGIEAAIEACGVVTERPDKYANDVVAACHGLDETQVRNIEAIVREERSNGTLAIIAGWSSGKPEFFRAGSLFQIYRYEALNSLPR